VAITPHTCVRPGMLSWETEEGTAPPLLPGWVAPGRENNCVPPEWRDVQIGFWVRVCARGAVEKNQAGQLRARIKQVQSISGQR